MREHRAVPMEETWRWFGPDDPISLRKVRQAGATGVVSALDHIPTGEAWPLEDILERKRLIESHGLVWSVVESVPLHNDIKTRSGDCRRYIDNYRTSLANLGTAGITRVCYNFMPVVDWTRTNLGYELDNRAEALRFDMAEFVAYDVYILQREGAAACYDSAMLERARVCFEGMSGAHKAGLEANIIAGLPGGEGSYDRTGIAQAIAEFAAIGNDGMRANLIAFLEDVLPTAEAAGVRMAIHPDDPPFSLFGLPRVVSTAADARTLLQAVPSASNGLTLCAGSFGARSDNDLVGMIREFGPHIEFVHLRNVRRERDGSFYESEHLDGDNDIVGIIDALLDEESRRRDSGAEHAQIPMRPDHGHTMGDELGRADVKPGYSFAGRMKGLAELRGVIHAISQLRGRQ